jgi:hypothetical protein
MDQEHEVSLGNDDRMIYNQEYDIRHQSNDMLDVEMGIEEHKKEKTKTPSTGKL